MDNKTIIFINPDDPENMEIATDERGVRLVFDSPEDADHWCEENAEYGNTYMLWNGER